MGIRGCTPARQFAYLKTHANSRAYTLTLAKMICIPQNTLQRAGLYLNFCERECVPYNTRKRVCVPKKTPANVWALY